MRRPTVARGGDVVRFGSNRRLMEVDRAGKSRTLAELDAGDFAWAPSGEEVFVATSSGSATEISAMRISGSKRRIGSLPGDWALHDVAHDGSLLMERIVQTFGIVGLAPGEARPRNLEWLDRSVAEDVSADGSTVLFNDRGPGGGAAYLRKMDGSPPVRLGDGDALAFSPDAKWVLTHRAGPPPELVLLPVGPGESRHLPGGDVEPQPGTAASWSRDGKRIVFYGAQKGRSARAFVQDVDGGPPRPVTPEGRLLRGKAVSPDGKWVISEDGNLQPVDGGAPRPIPGLQPGDVPFRFSADGRALVVASEVSRFRKRIFHIDLTTGTRTQILEVAPRQPVGDGSLGDVHLSDDEKTWVYSYMRYYSELYVVEGLK